MSAPRIALDRTALLVVDMQERLMPLIAGGDAAVERAAALIRGCGALGVPILATEQYPEKLGPTVGPIREAIPAGVAPVPKLKFSACVESVRQRLADLGRATVLICGIETHVCVLQTALDLLDYGHTAAIAADAVGSRRPADHDLALRRCAAAGVILASAEMALLEMVRKAGTERFKTVLPIIR